MVTGIETAGLALAILPLILEAVDRYREGFETMKDWWHFQQEFISFAAQLGFIDSEYRANLELLLSPLLETNEELQAMCNSAEHVKWQDPELAEGIKQTLPRNHEWFCIILNDMRNALEELARDMSGRETDKWSLCDSVTWDKAKWHYEFKRLRFSISKKRYKRQLKSLTQCNSSLRQMLDTSKRLEAEQIRRTRNTRTSTPLESIRDHAHKLYRALCSVWKCNCTIPHEVNLVLEQRPKRLNVTSAMAVRSDISVVRFDVNIATNLDDIHRGISVLVKPLPKNVAPPAGASSITIDESGIVNLTEVTHNLQTLELTRMPEKRRKRVAFQHEISSSNSTLVLNPIPAIMPRSMQNQMDIHNEILDLCSAIGTHHGRRASTLGCITFEDTKYLLDDVKDMATPSRKPDALTLHELLSLKLLNRQDRMLLALVLSSSILQLYSTAWLNQTWTSKDIYLIEQKLGSRPNQSSQSAISSTVDISRPFIVRQFPDPRNKTVAASSQGLSYNSEDTAWRLGVLLLELCFGETLESQIIRKQFCGHDGQPNQFTDRATATEWHKKSYDKAGEKFANAIRLCLTSAFSAKSTDLSNPDVRQSMQENVVDVIQKDLEYLYGNIPT